MGKGPEQRWALQLNKDMEEYKKFCSNVDDFVELVQLKYTISDMEVFLNIYWYDYFVGTQQRVTKYGKILPPKGYNHVC